MAKKKIIFLVALFIGITSVKLPAQSLNPTVHLYLMNEGRLKPFDLYTLSGANRLGGLIGNDFKLTNDDLINISVGADFALFKHISEARNGADFHIRSEYHFVPEKKWDWYGLACITYSHGLKHTISQYSNDANHTPISGLEVGLYSLWLQLGYGVQHHWSKHFSGTMEIVLRDAALTKGFENTTATQTEAKFCINFNLGVIIK